MGERAQTQATTECWPADETTIAVAADLIRQGELVVFPTDTVYGVGADAFNALAIDKLYRAKKRPLAKGIPILLADLKDVEKVAATVPELASTYMHRFWPGPLTLIVPKATRLPDNISPNANVAVRIPDNQSARALIRICGGAVATSSANRSGHPPAQTAADAREQLDGVVAAVLDDGPSPGGVASTVLDCTGEQPRILRHGPITTADLNQAL